MTLWAAASVVLAGFLPFSTGLGFVTVLKSARLTKFLIKPCDPSTRIKIAPKP